jgi:hypothetical protein
VHVSLHSELMPKCLRLEIHSETYFATSQAHRIARRTIVV